MSYQANQGALEFADVRTNILGNEESYVGWERYTFLLRFLLQNGNFRLEIGWLDVGDQAPFEAAAQAIFEFRQLFRRAIAGDHDLLHRFVQSVEGVEKFL